MAHSAHMHQISYHDEEESALLAALVFGISVLLLTATVVVYVLSTGNGRTFHPTIDTGRDVELRL